MFLISADLRGGETCDKALRKLAQYLVEHQNSEGDVASSTPAGPTLGVLK